MKSIYYIQGGPFNSATPNNLVIIDYTEKCHMEKLLHLKGENKFLKWMSSKGHIFWDFGGSNVFLNGTTYFLAHYEEADIETRSTMCNNMTFEWPSAPKFMIKWRLIRSFTFSGKWYGIVVIKRCNVYKHRRLCETRFWLLRTWTMFVWIIQSNSECLRVHLK